MDFVPFLLPTIVVFAPSFSLFSLWGATVMEGTTALNEWKFPLCLLFSPPLFCCLAHLKCVQTGLHLHSHCEPFYFLFPIPFLFLQSCFVLPSPTSFHNSASHPLRFISLVTRALFFFHSVCAVISFTEWTAPDSTPQ